VNATGRIAALAAAMLALPGLVGCSVNYLAPERYQNGLVVILDGAGDVTMAPQQIAWGLHSGGVRDAIEVFAWSDAHNVLADQTNLERNRQVAGKLTDRVLRYMSEHPDRPVHLIGLSAGTGIVIFAVEQLPPGQKVDGVCLLASSLSSTYDLSPALRHVRNEITNFSSMADVGVLGVGVGVAGTVDRGNGVAAGLGGFKVPDGASADVQQLYSAKVVEMPWNPTYLIYGHAGDHLGASSSGFVKKFMAPIVLDAQRRRGGARPADGASGKGQVRP